MHSYLEVFYFQVHSKFKLSRTSLITEVKLWDYTTASQEYGNITLVNYCLRTTTELRGYPYETTTQRSRLVEETGI